MASRTNSLIRQVDGKIQTVPATLPPLKPDEVLVKITHSGLCHTDSFFIPHGMAIGHEGVGNVVEIGSSVRTVKIGDRVGGGYHRKSCGHCKYCLSNQEIWCYERDIYGESSFNNGTFGDYFIGTETFVHKIPDSMSSSDAAPLQCAGATVYSGLIGTIKPGDRVGIIGIGGLGHLAIQFAAKLGAEVVVFSSSKDKEAEAKGFGAMEFVDLATPENISSPVDVLVLTGSKFPDWEKFLAKNVLARAGTIVPLTAETGGFHLPSLAVLLEGYNLYSSLVANRKVHDDMLRFAAVHGIKPAVEEFKLDVEGLESALEKLHSGKVRYRAVLVK